MYEGGGGGGRGRLAMVVLLTLDTKVGFVVLLHLVGMPVDLRKLVAVRFLSVGGLLCFLLLLVFRGVFVVVCAIPVAVYSGRDFVCTLSSWVLAAPIPVCFWTGVVTKTTSALIVVFFCRHGIFVPAKSRWHRGSVEDSVTVAILMWISLFSFFVCLFVCCLLFGLFCVCYWYWVFVLS